MPLNPDWQSGAMGQFQAGQSLAGGPHPLAQLVQGVMGRINQLQQAKMENRMKVQNIGLEAQAKGAADVETQRQLFPLKEAAAMHLLQEKARLFPQQPKALAGDTAGRLSLASQGQGQARQARQLLFPTGEANSFDRGLVLAMHSPFGLGMLGNQKAQSLEFNLKRAIDAQLRSETGAAVSPGELDRLTKEFIANAAANPEAAFERLQSLESGLGKTRSYIDPTGQYGRMASSPFESMSSDVSGLSDEEIFQGLQ